MSDKSDLWSRLEPTDPKYTKSFNRGGFAGTAINGTWLLKRLTEEFGPCGTGWRFVLDDEQIVEGHTLKSGDKAKLHIVRGHLDYRDHRVIEQIGTNGAKGVRTEPEWFSTSPQYGQTMLVGENKNGTFTDEEAPKKSITDCISKCAVLLGLGADVHLGMFDDNKYVNERKTEANAQREGLHTTNTMDPNEAASRAQHRTEPPKAIPGEEDLKAARAAYSAIMAAVRRCTSKREASGLTETFAKELATVKAVNEPGHQALLAAIKGAEAELPELD